MEEVVIKTDDWLKNAGILGLYRILSESSYGTEISQNGNSMTLSKQLLQNFSENYFGYFNQHYKKVFTIFVMIRSEKMLEEFEKKGLEKLSKDDVNKLNEKIKYFREKIKSNSYKSCFTMMGSDFKPEVREKELKEVKLKERDEPKDKIVEISNQVELLKDTIAVLNLDESKKYIGASNAMYNILNKAIGKVSFLNPQVKEKNMYKEFESYFSIPAINFMDEEKEKFKFDCFSCGMPIKDLSTGYSMLNHIGFDINRKTSNVWNFNNDASICPICSLIYACVPAGFTYLGNRGIFVNANHDIRSLQKINDKIRDKIYNHESTEKSVFAGLIEGMQKEFHEDLKFEWQDVQVVRFMENRYTFHVVTKPLIETIREIEKSKGDVTYLDNIKGAGWKEGNDYFYLYDEVMDDLINGRNLFLMIYKLLRFKLAGKSDCFFGMGNVYSLIAINHIYLKEVGVLSKNEDMKEGKSLLARARRTGHFLQEEYGGYEEGKYNKKLNGIAYRMLNALKTGNTDAFMDSFINAYMYVGCPIPSLFSEYLNEEALFKNLGYAFVTGMIGEKWKDTEKSNGEGYQEGER